MNDTHRTGGLRASAGPQRASEKTNDDAFWRETHAAARHAALVRRLNLLDRLVGAQPRLSLLIVAGAGGAVAFFLVLAALLLALVQQWRLAFEVIAAAFVVPHVLRAALIFLHRRADAARMSARAQMTPDQVAWQDAHFPPPRRRLSAMDDELDTSMHVSWREQWALVFLLAPRVLSFALFVAGLEAYHAARPHVDAWLKHRQECRIERLDAAIALLDLPPRLRAQELARCPNVNVATFRDESGAPTAVGRSMLASVQSAADDGARAAIRVFRSRLGTQAYFDDLPEERRRYEEDGPFREGFESVSFRVFRGGGDRMESVRAVENELDARAARGAR